VREQGGAAGEGVRPGGDREPERGDEARERDHAHQVEAVRAAAVADGDAAGESQVAGDHQRPPAPGD